MEKETSRAKVFSDGVFAASVHSADQMPVLFLGHGSPMNAIEDNEFVLGWRDISKLIRKA